MKFTINDYINHLCLAADQTDSNSLQTLAKTQDNPTVPLHNHDWLPLLLFTNTVLFPGVFTHFALKEENTINFVKNAYEKNAKIGIVAPKKNTKKNIKNLYPIGTQAQIHKIITMSEEQTIIILQGQQRFEICEINKQKEQLIARVNLLKDDPIDTDKPKNKALIQSLKEATIKNLSLIPDVPEEIQMMIQNIKNPVLLTYYIASNALEFRYKQKLLEAKTSQKRATLLLSYVLKNLEFTKLKRKIQHQAHTDIDKHQRELYIKQQIKVLQKELGETQEPEDNIDELARKGKRKKWTSEVKAHFEKTLHRLAKTHPNSPDYTILTNYAQLLIDLPWQIHTKDKNNIVQAKKILDKEHYGMEKVKERILEFLAVRSLSQTIKTPIICLHGPPGTGKTSLSKNIAKSLGKKFCKMSVGGVHDIAELKGHRKTYVGAMPGRPLTLIKNAGSANPVFILDEIDKIEAAPAAVLLEMLDPNQNHAFMDNFLEVPFDFSNVLFITTANNRYNIPWALADRMEFIEINGYAQEEKVAIAKNHLIPKQRKLHGIKATDMNINQPVLHKLIQSYTSESGVRELTRQIASLCRKTAKRLVANEKYVKKIDTKELIKLLGREKYDIEHYQKITMPGVAIGLAWTAVGGEILFIEAVLTKGDGKLIISGQLGDVMEESAKAAHTYLKANASSLTIDQRIFEKYDLHIHVPDGATPKDGPSAGITLYTTLASLYTQQKVKEKIAMTGEITLRGMILPVGGIKEKILAAKRVGITQILMSKKNKKDVEEIKLAYIKGLTFHYLEHVDQLLPLVLEKEKVPDAKIWDVESKSTNKKRINNK